MRCIPITTRVFQPPKDDIFSLLDDSISDLREKDILIVSSKIMAIHQGRCIVKKEGVSKHDLVSQVTDKYLEYTNCNDFEFVLSIVENALISSAGIDSSNADGYFVYLPERPSELCEEICRYLMKKYGLKELAVIAVDSHSLPLRYGAVGISIGMFGMKPLRSYVGKEDIFGEIMKVSRTNIIDSLASMATLVMGEGKERRPLAVVRGAEDIEFVKKQTFEDNVIPEKEDMYYPLLKLFERKNNENII